MLPQAGLARGEVIEGGRGQKFAGSRHEKYQYGDLNLPRERKGVAQRQLRAGAPLAQHASISLGIGRLTMRRRI